MRREYAGAARKARLAAPLGGSAVDLGILGDDLTGWPTGAGGPFFVVIGRGTPSEEKILCESRTGNSLTVFTDGLLNGRGADGTNIVSHDFNDYLEHVHTATDADEANEHVNSTANVHGVISDLVGVNDTQTLTNKSIDGNANTLTNIPQASVTGLTADLADLEATDVSLQNQITALDAAKANKNSPTFTGTVSLPSSTSIGLVSSTEIESLNGILSNVQDQLNSKAPTNNPTFSGTVYLPSEVYIAGTPIGPGGDFAVLPPGGATGEVLTKLSGADYHVGWQQMTIIGNGAAAEAIWPSGAFTTGTVTQYTDPISGYLYEVVTWDYTTGSISSVENTVGVIGKLLIQAGGGAGGGPKLSHEGGGGGAGAAWYGDYAFGAGIHTIRVGGGGTPNGGNGQDSQFDNIICFGGGGGGGGGGNSSPAPGKTGGCGGGGGGFNGGNSGGGLGIGGSGIALNTFSYSNGSGGNGGSTGLICDITGVNVTYGTGGPYGPNVQFGSGAPGTNGLGNGGQGAGFTGGSGGAGGHGRVIVRYRIG